jgi:hypothetical protein
VAQPLRWNTPAFVWNAPGVVWNGVEKPTKTAMPKVKAVVDFTTYPAPELTPVATMIHDKMLENVAIFVTPQVAMTVLKTAIDDYMAKLAARASNADSDEVAFFVARHALEADLAELGHYVNGLAKGDPVIVDASGFPSYSTARTPDYSAPAAPTNVRVRQGDVSGQWIMRYKPDRDKSMNEIQQCLSDPNVEANWTRVGMFGGGKAQNGGYAPGTTIWLRARTCGLQGIMGAWSDPAKIMVV